MFSSIVGFFSAEKGLKLDLWNRDPESARISGVAIGDRDGVVTSEWQVRDIQGEYRGTKEFGFMGLGENRKPELTKRESIGNGWLWGQ